MSVGSGPRREAHKNVPLALTRATIGTGPEAVELASAKVERAHGKVEPEAWKSV
jgi:hypothetical protein